MLEFTELSEEELNAYVKSSLSGDEEYEKTSKLAEIKSDYTQKVEKIEKRINTVLKDMKELKSLIAKERFDDSFTKSISVSKRLNQMAKEMNILPANFGYAGKTNTVVAGDDYPISFHYLDNNILHIVLPESLPHKVKYNDNNNAFMIMQDYNYNKQQMYNAFSKEFAYGKFKVYEETVVLYIVSYYENTKYFMDVDNVEYKIITDIIAMYLLIDDNPMWCRQYLDARLGSYNHAEVYVIPQSKFIDFLREREE